MRQLLNTYLTIKTVRNFIAVFLIRFGLLKGKNIQLNLRDGYTLFIRPESTDHHEVINVLGGKEYPYRLYKHLIHNKSIIIDIGGHIGTFVIYMRKHSPYGKIYVFEPDNENIDMLQKNIALNHITNVYIEKKAVADRDGYLRFQANELNKNEGHLIKRGGIQVEAIKLDTYVKQKSIDRIDLLKLDCEGAEYQILKSFKNLHICRGVMIEYHHTVPGKNMNKQWIISHMTSNNFKLLYSVVTGANDICGKLFFVNHR